MFAELDATSNFTFLTGGSHPEELVERAALLGLSAIAIADENSVAGIVRAHSQIKEIVRREADPEAPRTGWSAPDTPYERYPGLADASRSGPSAKAEPPPPSISPEAPRLIPAVRLVTRDGLTITALPTCRTAWGRLCRLLSLGRLRAEKGRCDMGLQDILDWADGHELLLHPPSLRPKYPRGEPPYTGRRGADASPFRPDVHRDATTDAPSQIQAPPSPCGAGAWLTRAQTLTRRFPGRVSLLLAPRYDGDDAARFDRLANLAQTLQIPTAAAASPVMHHGSRRRLTDVLTAIRLGTRVDELGRAALANAERRLRSEAEMRDLLGPHQHALDRAGEIARRCTFSLDELRYEYPSEIVEGESPADRLRRLAHEGLAWRYPSGASDKVRKTLEHELQLIAKLGYEPYFLTVNDVVAFARSRGILCQGRGSAANSVVCYCLGVTSVSPEIGTMVFERFVSEARNEPPDIDVDFEHERREEVIQHIYDRYGRHRAGLCATVIHYRGKRALREVGRAMGLTDDTIGALSSQLWGFFSTEGLEDQRLREIGLDPERSAPASDPCAGPRDPGLPAPPLPACRRLRHHRGTARRALPDRERDDGGPYRHPVGQGRHRRARHPQGRRPGARDADLRAQGLRPRPPAPRHRLHAGHAAARGSGRLRHALPRRHDRRLPGESHGRR